MAYLPLANLMHHKLRSALSAFGIGIGICMLVTLSGLSRGSLYEVADRWDAVDADLFAYPEIWAGNVTNLAGDRLSDKYGEKLLQAHGDIISSVIPIFIWRVNLAGQGHLSAGVDPENWNVLVGGRELSAGRMFDPEGKFSDWLEAQLLLADQDDREEILELTASDLADPEHNGLEIIVDSRLAEAGQFVVNDTVRMANYDFTVVGIVPAGGMTRVYLPRRTSQFLFGNGDITKSTLLFIKLKDGVDPTAAARKLKMFGLDVAQIEQFRFMLEKQFGIMFVYVDAVNIVALVIAFLFIMITLYTMVLQRTRDIAILKSSGASNAFLVRQVLAESLLLSLGGTLTGIGLSVPASWAIEHFWPLLTVQTSWRWIIAASIAAVIGAFVSGLYPAWRATRVDMVEAMSYE